MINLALTNIFNNGKEIYCFHRVGKELKLFRDSTFFPYWYEPDSKGVFKGYYGKKLKKVHCRDPYRITQDRTPESYESDVIYTKRYLLDKIYMTKPETRWIMFDCEMITESIPDPQIADKIVSAITCYDNYTKKYTSFCITDYNLLSDKANERAMYNDFVKYIKCLQPDLLIAYNAFGYDYPYLINRFQGFAEEISPLGKSIKKNNYPAGISIVDYMELIKKVYKYKKYSLEYVYCDTFKLQYKHKKYDFNKISEDIKEKNIADVRKMVEIEDKLRLLDYFDELRREAKVLWEDVLHNSRLIDGVLLQIAKEKGIILPKRPDYEENNKFIRTAEDEDDSIKGAYVYAEPGLHGNTHLFDISGTYPNLIVTFCIDPENKTQNTSGTSKIRNIRIKQNPLAIVPAAAQKLMNKRKEIQALLETKSGAEYQSLKKKDEAIKSLVNSLYGVMLFKSSRLFDKDIGSTITFLARFLIRYTKFRLRKFGYHVIQSDTDSIFVESQDDYSKIESIINTTIIPEFLKHFGKEKGTLKFKYEGTFDNLYIQTKKHYIGDITLSNGDKSRMIKGLEIKRSDSSKFTEEFQTKLFDKILGKESKENVISWIKEEKKRIQQLPIEDIAFPCKLQRHVDEYKNTPIFVRGMQNTQYIGVDFEPRIGSYFYYIYVMPTRTKKVIKNKISKKKIDGEIVSTKKKVEVDEGIDVLAFDEDCQEHIVEIDWNQMIERNIYMKCEDVFKAMTWDIQEIK